MKKKTMILLILIVGSLNFLPFLARTIIAGRFDLTVEKILDEDGQALVTMNKPEIGNLISQVITSNIFTPEKKGPHPERYYVFLSIRNSNLMDLQLTDLSLYLLLEGKTVASGEKVLEQTVLLKKGETAHFSFPIDLNLEENSVQRFSNGAPFKLTARGQMVWHDISFGLEVKTDEITADTLLKKIQKITSDNLLDRIPEFTQ